jgi:hypothetical protein
MRVSEQGGWIVNNLVVLPTLFFMSDSRIEPDFSADPVGLHAQNEK